MKRLFALTVLLALGVMLWPGCEYRTFRLLPEESPTTQPESASQPENTPPSLPSPTSVDAPTSSQTGPIIQVLAAPTTQPTAAPATNDLGLPVGVPEGFKIAFAMPGQAGPPLAGDAARKKQATLQAALAVAIYNVTKEINSETYRDEMEKGYVSTDHYRYRDGARNGLEVKSQTIIMDGQVKQFDIWLIVPPGDGQGGFQVQVRNHKLVGDPIDQARLKRILSTSGGHIVVTGVAGPNEQGMCTIEVALVRKQK